MMRRSPQRDLQFTRLVPESLAGLSKLLRAVERNGESRWFQPHPFDETYLATLCEACGDDLYYVLGTDDAALGYGLLRGWKEGYTTPSLGVAVHPDWRGYGLGLTIMGFLHCAARVRGAARIRLRVHEGNSAAIALYERLGYEFEKPNGLPPLDGLLVAFKVLRT